MFGGSRTIVISAIDLKYTVSEVILSCFQLFGCSTLFGRSSYCVFQSGWLWNTSVTCEDSAHRQDRPLGTVSECWYNLMFFILQALSVSLASSLLLSLRKSRILLVWYSVVLFKFYWSCRCLCWDHASSWAFENTMAYSDAETGMNSIVFQERVHVSTSSTV